MATFTGTDWKTHTKISTDIMKTIDEQVEANKEDIKANTDLIDSLSSWTNLTSQVITTDAISTINSNFLVSTGNIAIIVGYFVINAGTYTAQETLLTLPIKPNMLLYFNAGDQNGCYVFRLNTNGEISANNTLSLSSNKYMFSNCVIPL